MDTVSFIIPVGLLGISYLYWAILTFLIALITLFIHITPFALPRNPSNWILKKYILYYFQGAAWLIMTWVFYRLHVLGGELTFWLGMWMGIAGILFLTFLVVWILDRYKIRKLKDKNRNTNS